MYPGGYTAEVTCLSPKATEKDVYDFFIHCGMIEHLEIIRYFWVIFYVQICIYNFKVRLVCFHFQLDADWHSEMW